jgi:hypothetical protein
MNDRHPALTRLDALVGRWTVQPKVEFTVLYADARGVHRVYRMTFADRVWPMWRGAPGFNQRFTGTLSADGDTVDGRWEISPDGVTWNLDFELTYSRVR